MVTTDHKTAGWESPARTNFFATWLNMAPKVVLHVKLIIYRSINMSGEAPIIVWPEVPR